MVNGERRERGFTMIEMVVALAVFGILILVSVEIEQELFRAEKTQVVDFFSHPELDAIVVRLRADVLDSTGYPASAGTWRQSPKTLLLSIPAGNAATIVAWDFSHAGEARRLELHGSTEAASWVARGTPSFEISSVTMPDGTVAVHLVGTSSDGERIVDRVFAPRAH